METVGAFEAKTKLSELLERVAAGEEFLITRHGQPLARLVPASRMSRSDVAQAIEEFEKLQSTVQLNPPGTERLTIRQLIDQGRKW